MRWGPYGGEGLEKKSERVEVRIGGTDTAPTTAAAFVVADVDDERAVPCRAFLFRRGEQARCAPLLTGALGPLGGGVRCEGGGDCTAPPPARFCAGGRRLGAARHGSILS
ncbi:hypothetical protein MTO96_018421 [Rhipicephalus appendiculatus]